MPPYANTAILSKYIAAVDPTKPPAETLRVRLAKRTTMLRTQLNLALMIVTTSIGLTVWALVSYPPDFRGVGTLYFGSCSTTKTMNGAVHFALNIISSLFLGAGNYCMQILAAPSREEIDRAHSKGVSLDIGVPSLKNLRHIQRRRVIVWALIGICAAVLHLL